MATTLKVPAAGVRILPAAPLRWCLSSSFAPGDHRDSIFVRWLADDGRALFTALALTHEDGELVLLRLNGPDLDSDALDTLYDDVARRIEDGPQPRYEVQTTQEVIEGCSHPYAKAMAAKDWTFPASTVCSYCGGRL